VKKRNRVRVIEYFVDVAKECINIGNFNSLMAIIGKLLRQSCCGLHRLWFDQCSECTNVVNGETFQCSVDTVPGRSNFVATFVFGNIY